MTTSQSKQNVVVAVIIRFKVCAVAAIRRGIENSQGLRFNDSRFNSFRFAAIKNYLKSFGSLRRHNRRHVWSNDRSLLGRDFL